ncbi:MAG TPA: protein phosphatase 2C domain-containing protein [Actinomycetes bacterium]|jgi:protein phosphatase|nr:protein phosphatase 2C domain-containing protein [Actinomycetes bacterium]
MLICAFARSDPGRVRDRNEDSHHPGRTLFAVADGLGGHSAGEVASATAVRVLARLDGMRPASVEAAREELVAAFEEANRVVRDEAALDPARAGMGTTLTAALLAAEQLVIAHVGDSRAYLLRPGEPLRQLTNDQTVVAEMVRQGRLSRDQAASHPYRSVLTTAIGLEREVDIQLPPPLPLRSGDQVLLCSDGLTEPVGEDMIAELLMSSPDGDATCDALVDAANAAGGPDNVTVVLVRTAKGDPGA